MPIIAKDSGGEGFDPMPSGTHVAVCNMVVDLGKQETEYQGEKSMKHQIYVRWETPNERLEWADKETQEKKEGPRIIGKTYTLSLHENASLRADLEQWRGRAFTEEEKAGFDVSKLLGVPCMISVTHRESNGKNYANVAAVTALPKGMDSPQTEIGLLLYDDENQETYGKLNKYLQEKINKAGKQSPPENESENNTDLDDDIPF